MRSLSLAGCVAYAVALYAFIFLPVVVLVAFSFQAGGLPMPPLLGLSLRWYEAGLADRELMAGLANSLGVGLVSSALATGLALLAALPVARRTVPLPGLLRALMMAPLGVSTLVVGLGLLVVLNALGIPKSLGAVVIGHTVVNLPVAFVILLGQVSAQHVTLERAARDLGAPEHKVLLYVTLPLLWPALAAAFCIAFTLSWDEFIIAFLLGRFETTLPVALWVSLRSGLSPVVNAVGTMVFLGSLALLAAAASLLSLRRVRP